MCLGGFWCVWGMFRCVCLGLGVFWGVCVGVKGVFWGVWMCVCVYMYVCIYICHRNYTNLCTFIISSYSYVMYSISPLSPFLHPSSPSLTLLSPLQMPEMNEVASTAAEGGWREAMHILLYQNIGIFMGITSLFCLAYFQDNMVLT